MEAWLLGMDEDKLRPDHENFEEAIDNFDEAIDKLEIILDGAKKKGKHGALNTLEEAIGSEITAIFGETNPTTLEPNQILSKLSHSGFSQVQGSNVSDSRSKSSSESSVESHESESNGSDSRSKSSSESSVESLESAFNGSESTSSGSNSRSKSSSESSVESLESGSNGTEPRPKRSGLEPLGSTCKKSKSGRSGSDSSGFVSGSSRSGSESPELALPASIFHSETSNSSESTVESLESESNGTEPRPKRSGLESLRSTSENELVLPASNSLQSESSSGFRSRLSKSKSSQGSGFLELGSELFEDFEDEPPALEVRRTSEFLIDGATKPVEKPMALEKPNNPKIEFVCISNSVSESQDPNPKTMELLDSISNIFSHQLPVIPKEYINELVFHPKHRTMVLMKNGQPIGGICFQMFPSQGFSEIAFCAVTTSEQVNFLVQFETLLDKIFYFCKINFSKCFFLI